MFAATPEVDDKPMGLQLNRHAPAGHASGYPQVKVSDQGRQASLEPDFNNEPPHQTAWHTSFPFHQI
ncbi:unnamed protein product [Dovyalis caffra]|uniref:Uncharacterized protein n=1 Tax=Dovyalis caffra TaxID=77055 RepID=A0AAV1S918_9ROSI|nr:unnamed protein product [Dovyalis caffra]